MQSFSHFPKMLVAGERITIADTLYQRFFPSAVENEDDGTISVKETAKQAEDRKLPQIKRESGVSTSLRSPASPIRLSAGNATKLQPGSSLSSSTLPAASSSTWRMKLAAAKVKTQPDKHHVFGTFDYYYIFNFLFCYFDRVSNVPVV